jgi:hypothetical protein
MGVMLRRSKELPLERGIAHPMAVTAVVVVATAGIEAEIANVRRGRNMYPAPVRSGRAKRIRLR